MAGGKGGGVAGGAGGTGYSGDSGQGGTSNLVGSGTGNPFRYGGGGGGSAGGGAGGNGASESNGFSGGAGGSTPGGAGGAGLAGGGGGAGGSNGYYGGGAQLAVSGLEIAGGGGGAGGEGFSNAGGGGGGAGGYGAVVFGTTIDNVRSITGGAGGAGGGSTASSYAGNGGDGGVGLAATAAGAKVTNEAGAAVSGGSGGGSDGAVAGAGGTGIAFTYTTGGAYLSNAGKIYGGSGGAGTGGAGTGGSGGSGVAVDGTNSQIINTAAGKIVGGSSANGAGGIGILGSGTITNAGYIAGGVSSYNDIGFSGGGAGVFGSAVDNQGTILGGQGVAQGGVGVFSSQTITNESDGVIKGGDSASGTGGIGASSEGTLTNLGEIDGGSGGGSGGAGSFAFSSVGSATILNAGTIQGGSGDVGGSYVGSGGAGIEAYNATVVNGGSIVGGVGKGQIQADAVAFGGAGNKLALVANASFSGALDLQGATLTFDQSAYTGLSADATLSAPIIDTGGIIKVGAGKLTLNGDSSYSGGTIIKGGTIEISGSLGVGSGAVSFQASANNTATLALQSGAQPAAGGIFGNTLDSFGTGDALDLEDFSLMGASVRYNASGQKITVSNSSGSETFKLSNVESGVTGFQTASDGNDGTLVTAVVCFASGSLIRTVAGDVPVEALVIGDLVVTASGLARPIRWLGHRTVDCRRHADPRKVMPVRIAAHAFGPNKPARDLYVSPGHCICLDIVGEVLIPAEALVNGATVQQVEVDAVTYWHVELDSHDVILAEHLPCESYLDMGNRDFFAEGDVVRLDMSPDADPIRRSHAEFCRPYHDGGPLIEAVRAQMRARALALGWRLSDELEVYLEVDGARVDPVVCDRTIRFLVPAEAKDVAIVSPTARPHDTTGAWDMRDLGIDLAALRIEDGFGPPREVAVDDPLLDVGFFDVEAGGHRWTTGRARLPAALWAGCADTFFLRLDLCGPPVARWVAPSGAPAACLDFRASA